jgi:hypothetical protein
MIAIINMKASAKRLRRFAPAQEDHKNHKEDQKRIKMRYNTHKWIKNDKMDS